jgi:molecular chaperone GrpE
MAKQDPTKREATEQAEQEGAAEQPEENGRAAAAGTPDGGAAAPEAAAVAPDDPLASAQREAAEYRDLLQRERASFQNYRRRVEGERAGQAAQARAEALLPLLPIIDDLERAAADVPADLREQPWVKGVLLITDKLAAAMAAAGLERIDPLGQPFDPRYHEAFMHERRADIPAGNVSTVMRTGYRLGDRVLRAAQVAVSQGKAEGDS